MGFLCDKVPFILFLGLIYMNTMNLYVLSMQFICKHLYVYIYIYFNKSYTRIYVICVWLTKIIMSKEKFPLFSAYNIAVNMFNKNNIILQLH